MLGEHYGPPQIYNNKPLIAEQAIRRTLTLNRAATVTIDSDVPGVEVPSRLINVGPIQFMVENHGRENGFLLSTYGLQASVLIEGVVTQVFVPYLAFMQLIDHRTREVTVIHPLLCAPVKVSEYPSGRMN